MDIFDSRYYNINKNLHRCLGCWPFQNRVEKYVLRCIVFTINISIMIPEVLNLINVRHDLSMVVDSLPILITQISHIAKYSTYIINGNEMKELFKMIKQNWLIINTDEERNILREYAEFGRTISFITVTAYDVIATLYILMPMMPRLLDALHPLNTSRPFIFVFESEYTVDREKYYTQISIHHYIVAVTVITSIAACDATYGVYAHHACSMFAIVRHQLDNLPLTRKPMDNVTSNEMNSFKRVVDCIEIHQRAIRFSEKMESAHVGLMFVMLFISVTSLSITGVQTMSHLDQPLQALRFSTLCVGHFLHIYYHTWNCQKILNHSSVIHDAAYNAEWYMSPGKTVNLLRMMMCRSSKPCIQTAGKVFPLTRMNFTVIVKTSMSYFTVLTNFQ